MSLTRKSEIGAIAFCVVVAFGIIWYRVSTVTPPWSDEPRHLLAAKSLAISGKPVLWDFTNVAPVKIYYIRGMVMTYPVAFLYRHGLSQLIWARSVPLVFVLLTLLLWMIYLKCKKRLNGIGVALLIIFFLGQPIVFEQATYVRMYAPFGLLFSIASICLWELKEALEARRGWLSTGLVVLFLLSVWIPKMDSWQIQHIPQLLLALAMLNDLVWRGCISFFRKPIRPLLLFVGIWWIGPIFCRVLGAHMSHMVRGWGIHIGYEYSIYWDNMGGLIRFLLAVNVMLFGLRWIIDKPDQRDFFRWLYLSGLWGGIFLAVFTPDRFIFYSRYFYVPIISVTVGFVGMCVQEDLKPWFKRVVIGGYLIFSILFTFVNFYFDRSNLPVAVDWLKKNMGPNDVVLYYNRFYGLNDGEELTGKNVYLIKDQNIDRVIKFVSAPGIQHVYCLMNDNYKFRDFWYEKTTGHHRGAVANRIANYLTVYVHSPEILDGLRQCELKESGPDQLVAALTKLKKKVGQ